MLLLPSIIEPLFVAAGWKRPVSGPATNPSAPSSTASARLIIDQFKGLKVGECGPGTEQAASDIHFCEGIAPDTGEVLRSWVGTVGDATAFATAHNDHILLFVGPRNDFYIYTDPDDRLYAAGCDFGELMRRLLLGCNYGPEVEKDA